ncbi:MAG: hypothetical protein K2W95_26685 [Candidatus Obscuribacterales bacterium]|nr:hypothetical protein [Candidatus Obscuribacterales bacterium]
MQKLFSKFLLAVLATGTLAVGVQGAAEAQRYWGGYYDYGYSPYYAGFNYNPYYNGYNRAGWSYYNSPYSWNSGYWNGDSAINTGARFLLHGLLDEIF